MQRIPAFQNPHEANRPRLKRQTLSFKKAIEDLKNATSSSVNCAAIHSYGRCRKIIPFDRPYLLSLLDQLSINDVGSVVNLMPLVLCPTHWEKTVYYNAIFLDWISHHGLKLDTQDYENIVVDFESAKFIKEEDCSVLETSISSSARAEDQERHSSTTSSPTKGDFSLNGNSIQVPANLTNTKLPSSFTLTASSVQTSNLAGDPGAEKSCQTQDHPKGSDPPAQTPPEDERAHEDIPGTLNLVSLRVYASLELGVAKLEIMYQKNLKCISMASYGWRCQEIIQTERLPKARRILSSLTGKKEELKDLAMLVLCPGHSRGELPQLYSEAWSVFAAKRLPKEEAMTRFDPNHWTEVQFFDDQNTHQTEPRKTKSTSNLRQTKFERSAYPSPDRVEVESKSSTPGPRLSQGKRFDFFLSADPPGFNFTIPRPPASLQSGHLSKIPPPSASSVFTTPQTSTSTSIPSQVSAPVADYLGTSGDLDDAVNHLYATSAIKSDNMNSTFDRSPSPSLAKRTTISPTGGITVRLPPSPSAVSSDVSNLSSELTQIELSSDASSFDCRDSVNAADSKDRAVLGDIRSDQTAPRQRGSALLTFRRDSKLPVRKSHQGVIDGNIVKEICSSIPTGGYVYVFKSADRGLVKIGKATNILGRKKQIKTECQLEDLEEIDSDSYHIAYPERVEKLVHLELQNFRANVICQHLHGGSSDEIQQEHREWFDVPDDVAVQSVKRRREFVEKAYTPQGTIRDRWASKATRIPRSSSLERRYLKTGFDESNGSDLERHHQLRHERYRDWMEDVHS